MERYLSLTENCVFCLQVVTLLVNISDAQDKLRVGVPEQFMSVAMLALQDSGLVNSFELLPIESDGNGLSLTNINKTYSNARSLDLDAVVGPFSIPLDLVAESLNIPYLSTSFDFTLVNRRSRFEMLPGITLAGQAMLEVMKAYGWTRTSLFYDDSEGVSLVEQLVTNHSVQVHAWKLPSKAKQHQARSALIEIRKNRIKNILVVCNKENTRLLLHQAESLAMLCTPYNHWMFYDPGLESHDVLTMYKHIQVNFTVISLLDFNDTLKSSNPSKIEFALTSDAFKVLLASKAILWSQSNNSFQGSDGSGLNHAVMQTLGVGHTGILAFDSQRRRNNVTLTLTTVAGDRTVPRGIWYSNPSSRASNLNLSSAVIPLNPTRPSILSGIKVKVALVENEPFAMLKSDHETRKGNDKFKGYSVDFMYYISRKLNFKFELYLVPDGKYGSKMNNGQWNGVIGELVAGNASMSVGPITINAERATAVDFTKPFMTSHISALIRVPTYETSYLQILSPFSQKVWILIIIAFIVVSWILYVLEKIGRTLNDNIDSDAPELTLGETIWFTFGSLVKGSIEPIATSLPGRILTSAWWFFGLILISSYTANLAAFLTAKNIATPIKSVTDLNQQNKIKYGTVKDSSTEMFFRNTKTYYFSKMWAQMSEVQPDSMVNNEAEALEKVKKDDYAFFWDSSVIKYIIKVDCDLMEIGPPVNPMGYGIAVPPGASYLNELSMEILNMSDRGILEYLKYLWWEHSDCPDRSGVSEQATSIQLESFVGIFFIIVIGGIVFASLVCLAMYCFPNLLRIPEIVALKFTLDKTPQGSSFPSPPPKSVLTRMKSQTSNASIYGPSKEQVSSSKIFNLQRLSNQSSNIANKHVHSNTSARLESASSPVISSLD